MKCSKDKKNYVPKFRFELVQKVGLEVIYC